MKKFFYLLFCVLGLFGCIRTEAAELNPEAEFIAVRDTGRESRKKIDAIIRQTKENLAKIIGTDEFIRPQNIQPIEAEIDNFQRQTKSVIDDLDKLSVKDKQVKDYQKAYKDVLLGVIGHAELGIQYDLLVISDPEYGGLGRGAKEEAFNEAENRIRELVRQGKLLRERFGIVD